MMFSKIYQTIVGVFAQSLLLMLSKNYLNFVILSLAEYKSTHPKFYKNIEKCLPLLAQSQFRVRAIISDSHTTNMNAYSILLTNY